MIKDDDDDQSVGDDKTEPDTWRHPAGHTALPGPGHGDTVTIHLVRTAGTCSHAVLMQSSCSIMW